MAQHSIAMAQHLKLRGDNASAAAQPKKLSIHNATLIEKLRKFTQYFRAQFGPDSNEAQSIGYKKKSERKRPRRAPKAVAM